jgi:YjzC-like protein
MSYATDSVYIGQTYTTGQRAPVSGKYEYVRHTQPTACAPSWAERKIPLSKGETFPPHRSCGSGVVWKLTELI